MSNVIQEVIEELVLSKLNLNSLHSNKPQFPEYMKWLISKDKEAELQYWSNYLLHYDSLSAFPFLNDGLGLNDETERKSYSMVIDSVLMKKIKTASVKMGITWGVFLYSNWGILLSKLNDKDDNVFGVMVSGRPPEVKGIESMVGVFVNTVPLRVKISNYDSFKTIASKLNSEIVNHNSNSTIALSEMNPSGISQLFNHVWVIENYPTGSKESKNGLIDFESIRMIQKTDMDVVVYVIPEQDKIKIIFSSKVSNISSNNFERIKNYFLFLLNTFSDDTESPVNTFSLVNTQLESSPYRFNEDIVSYDSLPTLSHYIDKSSERFGDNVGLVFRDRQYSFSQISEWSNRIANYLYLEHSVGSEDIVGVMMDRSDLMVLTIYGIIRAGAAYLPIDSELPVSRIEHILKESNCKVLIVSQQTLKTEIFQDYKNIIAIDNLNFFQNFNHTNSKLLCSSNNLAYVIYTSGSTGNPKGVMIEHQAIVNRLEWMNAKYPLDLTDTLLQKTPYTFDVSVWELFWSLFSGAKLVVLEPGGHKDPKLIYESIKENKISVIHFVPSMLNLFLEFGKDDLDLINTSLKDLRYCFASGEALYPKLVNEFNAIVNNKTGATLHNLYGPTEAAVDVIYYDCLPMNNEYEFIPIGSPVANTTIYIMDRHLNLQPVDVIGELYIGGVQLARGYINNLTLTNEKFIINPFIENERLYKTGDFAKIDKNGFINYIGRKDDQVKIRGIRVELLEIEHSINSFPEIDECVVTAEGELSKDIFCYYKSSIEIDEGEFNNQIRAKLPEYMIPSKLIRIEKVPLSISGKVDRRELQRIRKSLSIEIDEDSVEAENQLTDKQLRILTIWKEVIGTNKISIKDRFLDIGGHSLKAIKIVNRMNKEFGAKVSIRDLYQCQTIENVAFLLESYKDKSKVGELTKAEKKEFYDLSLSQYRLWVLEQFDVGNSYSIPLALKISSNLNVEKLEKTINKIIDKFEILRTVIIEDSGVPKQFVKANRTISLPITKVSYVELESSMEDFFSLPLNITSPDIYHIRLFEVEGDSYILCFNIHHIIFDGWSAEVLFDLILNFYSEDTSLDESNIGFFQYSDFSEWQRSRLLSDKFEKEENYWIKKISNFEPTSDLLPSYPRPKVKTYNGLTKRYSLGYRCLSDIKNFSNKLNKSVFSILVSSLNLLIYRITNQSDICLGIPVAGRGNKDLESQIGYFVNTVVLRNQFSGNDSVIELIEKINTCLHDAFENQDYPFEILVEKAGVVTNLQKSPIFDVLVTLREDTFGSSRIKDGVSFEKFNLPSHYSRSSKFDLSFIFEISNEDIFLDIEYNTDIYSHERIEYIYSRFFVLLTNLVNKLNGLVSEIEIISDDEKMFFNKNVNRKFFPLSSEKSIVDYFSQQVERSPDSVAIKFGSNSLTYLELDLKSNSIANHLLNLGLKKGSVVGLLMEKSIDLLISLLGIIKAGGAYMPLNPSYPLRRIEYCLDASTVEFVLIDRKFRHFEESLTLLSDCNYIDFDSAEQDQKNEKPGVSLNSDDLAYVMFTSGTTGNPKGVMIEHGNVVHLVKNQNCVKLNENTIILQTGAIEFDASTFEIWGPLLNGGCVCLLDKVDLLDSESLSDYIIRWNINLMYLSSPLFNQLTEINPIVFENLNTLIVGGDILSPYHVNKVKSLAPKLEIVNGYGPTENTTFSSFHKVENTKENVIPIGTPLTYSEMYIVDDDGNLLPPEIEGDLLVGGRGVGRGYLNDTALTNKLFCKNTYSNIGKLYRTGDRAKWSVNWEAIFLGRKDHQYKINGYRVEKSEIENTLLKHANINEVYVVIEKVGNDLDKEIVAYLGTDFRIDYAEICEYLRDRIPSYMIPDSIVLLKSLPLLASGKVDRSKLYRNQELEKFLPEGSGQGAIEVQLLEIIADILKINCIDRSQNLFSLNTNSLKVIRITSKIREIFGIRVPISFFYNNPTVEALARFIENQDVRESIDQIIPSKFTEYLDLSRSQYRIWLAEQFGNGPLYNIPGLIVFNGSVSCKKLEHAYSNIIEKYEILRTIFPLLEKKPMQFIQNKDFYSFKKINFVNEAQLEQYLGSAVDIPFNLEIGPLIKAEFLTCNQGKTALFINVHHIIFDGWSVNVFLRDLIRGYNSEVGNEYFETSPILQYRDFTIWQFDQFSKKEFQSAKEYWINKLDGVLHNNAYFLEKPRPNIRSNKGITKRYEIENKHSHLLDSYVNESNLTLFMILLASLKVLIYKYSGVEDVIVGSPIAGRENLQLEEQIGFYVNLLVLRDEIRGEMTVNDLLLKVKKTVVDAIENQIFPFDFFQEELNIVNDPGTTPLFSVMLALQNFEIPKINLSDGVELEYQELKTKTSKYDISFLFSYSNSSLVLDLEYNSNLFSQNYIDRLFKHFQIVCQKIISSSSLEIKNINIVIEEEKENVLGELRGLEKKHNFENENLVSMFEKRVSESPNDPAVYWNGGMMTYSELNNEANKVANYLISNVDSVKGSLVALIFDRSQKMLIAILGVLKTGAAYLPISPDDPKLRRDEILEQSQCSTIIFDKLNFSNIDIRLNCIEFDSIKSIDVTNPTIDIKSSDLAYVIYTSGSTGKPKGVMIEHASVLNRICWDIEYFNHTSSDRFLLKTPYFFDVSIRELFVWFAAGSTVAILDSNLHKSPEQIFEAVEKYQITSINFVPSMFAQFLEYLLSLPLEKRKSIYSLKSIHCSGEILAPHLVTKFNDLIGENSLIKLYNQYGPTETTVEVTCFDCSETHSGYSVPIGKPTDNVSLYILDNDLNILPRGLFGELYIGGSQVARGYLNSIDLTDDRFIKNPFGEGDRIYKTGDICKLLDDGNVEFHSRSDNQVKLRGFRIELLEVEAVLLEFPGIKNIAVCVGGNDKEILVAYYVAEEDIDTGKLIYFLKSRLPEYMIPHLFKKISNLPIGKTGKLDRNSLPKLSNNDFQSQVKYVEGSNPFEKQILKIWEQILSSERVGMNDNFFALGGHSLKALILSRSIFEHCNIKIEASFIYEYPVAHLFMDALKLKGSAQNIHSMLELSSLNDIIFKDESILSNGKKGLIFYFPSIVGIPVDVLHAIPYLKEYTIISFPFFSHKNRINMYIEKVERYSNGKPLVFLAYSAGGTLAYEVIVEMEKRSSDTHQLILLDSVLSDDTNFQKISSGLFQVGGEFPISLTDKPQFEIDGHLKDRFIDYKDYFLSTRVQTQINWKIHHIRSTEAKVELNYSWKSVTSGEYSEMQGFGTHNEMFNSDFAMQNSEIIKKILEGFFHHE
ncbi:non-ribosomal peptide synthetase [Leptospira vanthielii]|uniref:AMP-binding enzyme n=1 Tax=Leptospira vanthielii serovar Holland str. Waz Holland = ATCC 700522 TaxID=1218591 RepID=N1W6N2_9LEPT|nr:non-ribosomal peptide synthetase [Leptospira vanthielii]EMY71939.1 AMP-binding enzyme [Leptospira vanthielii serovar Holland str. Waz Holland = ATCC 700522]